MTHSPHAKQLIAYSFLVVFANDDTNDDAEMKMIERTALKDGIIDDEEKMVLRNLFSRVDPDHLTNSVREEIDTFRKSYDI